MGRLGKLEGAVWEMSLERTGTMAKLRLRLRGIVGSRRQDHENGRQVGFRRHKEIDKTCD